MLANTFTNVRTVLCIGSHSDDIEIGCGGTILQLLEQNADVHVEWLVLSASGEREEEAHRCAERFLRDAVTKNVRICRFRDSYFPYEGGQVKQFFAQLQSEVTPDIIFTHRREDMHQDHRLVAELTWNTFRNHLIYEYEIPKYEGDLGAPNVFVPLDKAICERKIVNIIDTFQSQRDRSWFTEDTFWALLRLRGIEAGGPCSFAEGLYCRKSLIDFTPQATSTVELATSHANLS